MCHYRGHAGRTRPDERIEDYLGENVPEEIGSVVQAGRVLASGENLRRGSGRVLPQPLEPGCLDFLTLGGNNRPALYFETGRDGQRAEIGLSVYQKPFR